MLVWTLGLAVRVSHPLTFGFAVALGLYADHALLNLTFAPPVCWAPWLLPTSRAAASAG